MYLFIESEPITYYNDYSGVDIDNYVKLLNSTSVTLNLEYVFTI